MAKKTAVKNCVNCGAMGEVSISVPCPSCKPKSETCALCHRKSDEYNGWKNYETWAVALWLDNEQGTQNYWTENAQELMTGDWEPLYKSQTKEDWAKCRLADRLKDEIEEGSPTSEASLYTDLMSAALSSVDWYEVAEHYIDAVKEG